MKSTKIDWCDATWNPVTGCRNDCPYCYARKQAHRFEGADIGEHLEKHIAGDGGEHELDVPESRRTKNGTPVQAAYPYGFDPTFHRYRLGIPSEWKEPKTIFVCSMADLFGEWVPQEWIQAVFQACQLAPQHKYLFLTKNPARYLSLGKQGLLSSHDNFWYGTTITNPEQSFFFSRSHKTFVSVEPIHEAFKDGKFDGTTVGWVIVGAETGKRTGKVVPKKTWIDGLAYECSKEGIPIYMKGSLTEIMGENLRQEYPWEVDAND